MTIPSTSASKKSINTQNALTVVFIDGLSDILLSLKLDDCSALNFINFLIYLTSDLPMLSKY